MLESRIGHGTIANEANEVIVFQLSHVQTLSLQKILLHKSRKEQ